MTWRALYLQHSDQRIKEDLLSASTRVSLLLTVYSAVVLSIFKNESSNSLLPLREDLSLSPKWLWEKYLKLRVCVSLRGPLLLNTW